MATVINAGRVAMVPKGEWSASTAYVRLDVVSYHGSSYVCKKDGTGQTPDTATNYWQLLSSGLDPTVDTIAAKHYEGSTVTAETSISAAGVISKTASGVTKTYDLPAESGTLALASDVATKANADDVAAALEKKANLTSLYRFAGFSIIADGSPEDAATAFGPYADVLSSKLDTYCPGWGDVADHRSILQLIRWNNAGSYNSEYLFTGAFGDGLRRAASEAHEMGFNSLVFPADLVVHEAGVDMLEERIDAVERDKADKSEIDAQKPLVLTTGTNSSGETIVTTPISEIRSAVAAGRDVQYTMTYNTVKVTLHLVDYISTSNYVMMNLSCVSRIGGRNIHIVSCEYLADMMEMSFTHEVAPFAELTARQIANVFAEYDLE